MNSRGELRLGLAMRGGVSLAVWIGGACVEIDELRRGGDEHDDFWRRLSEACGYDRVVVDVLAGASAGGLNGVLFAAAIRHGFQMKDLEGVWLGVAGVNQLRRTEAPWLSLFDGDSAFLDVIRRELTERIDAAGGSRNCDDQIIDLQLTATLVEPLSEPMPSPSDERLRRSRSGARFHFRHDGTGAAPHRDLEGDVASVSRLALAARSSSSYPFAFEAAVVRSTRPNRFGQSTDPGSGRLVDCRGIFSESRGGASRSDEPVIDDFVVADGGIVDNIPLGRALDAIADAPASGPTTRVLVYLHPTGPASPPGTSTGDEPLDATGRSPADRRRSVVSVGRAVLAARLSEETIDGDIAQLERHNRDVRAAAMLRAATSTALDPRQPLISEDRWKTYRAQRAKFDAMQVRELLDDPLGVLGEDPFPDGDDDGWRRPLAAIGWGSSERDALDDELEKVLKARFPSSFQRPLAGAVFTQGVGGLARVIDLLLEWVRANAASEQMNEAKESLYHVRSVVDLLDRTRRLGWVAIARRAEDVAGQDWCRNALAEVDRLVFLDRADARRLVTDGSTATKFAKVTNDALNALVEDGEIPAVLPSAIDVRAEVLGRLLEIVEPVLDVGTLEDDSAGVVDRILSSGEPLPERLAALEVLCLGERIANRSRAGQISFKRISAAASTPLAPRFAALYAASRALDGRPAGDRPPDDHLRPEVKLAGNELGSFSAFLDRTWRANDWLWGRLDAASDLISLLLERLDRDTDLQPFWDLVEKEPSPSEAQNLAALRAALIEHRQLAILEEHDLGADSLAGYDVGLETVFNPGSQGIRESAGPLVTVAAAVAREELPGPLKKLANAIEWVGRIAAWFALKPRSQSSGPTTPRPQGRVRALKRFVPLLLLGVLVAALGWLWADLGIGFLVGLATGAAVGLGLVVMMGLLLKRPPQSEQT